MLVTQNAMNGQDKKSIQAYRQEIMKKVRMAKVKLSLFCFMGLTRVY